MIIILAYHIDQVVQYSHKPFIFALRVRNENYVTQLRPVILSRLSSADIIFDGAPFIVGNMLLCRSFRLSPPTASAVAGPSTSSGDGLGFCDSSSRGSDWTVERARAFTSTHLDAAEQSNGRHVFGLQPPQVCFPHILCAAMKSSLSVSPRPGSSPI